MPNNNKQRESLPDNPSLGSNRDAKIRLFLVCWVAFATILVIIVYAITREASILATNATLAAAITLVFTYYFKKK